MKLLDCYVKGLVGMNIYLREDSVSNPPTLIPFEN
jgi:hypothetical protein